MSSLNAAGVERKVVEMGEFYATHGPAAVLESWPLGSGIGVSVYDPLARVGGLLHAPLPDSRVDPLRASGRPALFVNSGIGALLDAVLGLGANRHQLQVHLAGGADIPDQTGTFCLGQQNRQAAIEAMRSLRLPHLCPNTLLEVCSGRSSDWSNDGWLRLDLATGEVRLLLTGQGQALVLCKNSISS